MNPEAGRPIFSRMEHLVFETAAGFCAIAWTDAGIARFQLLAHARSRRSAGWPARAPAPRPRKSPRPWPRRSAISAARTADFSHFTLDLAAQDDFFRRIYAAVRRLGWGDTTTYGALAHDLGAGPEAARDVGQAMAHNPVPLIIPCHRVLAAGNRLGGFSAPGGATAKARMLELEGVRLDPPAAAQRAFAF